VYLRGELRSGLAVPLPQGLLRGVLPAATIFAKQPTAPADQPQRQEMQSHKK
jgi:hypothetical protein